MRRLVVVRHAKAEAYATTDHARELADRGRRDALELGTWLAESDIIPDVGLVSSARRTIGTWEWMSRGLRATPPSLILDELYSASPESALDQVRMAPEDAETVAIVGHNPTIAYLAHLLDDGEADPVAFRAMSEGYPTAAATVLDIEAPWADLDPHGGRVSAFHVGNGGRNSR